ncbi:hypothetical protein Cabys_1909 [Caldithrix abyssi DSM 13497]|uniref:Uncharacterized protein n=1 Tax=Caldithrix abyssi DSM 13497 TaxID=880073 RepID=A0A1J1C9J9_CALAY|nr:hypothetical protein Cabys_1909 [Caldithrix abyssi DSM 13497]
MCLTQYFKSNADLNIHNRTEINIIFVLFNKNEKKVRFNLQRTGKLKQG